jgi:hypothetical protein
MWSHYSANHIHLIGAGDLEVGHAKLRERGIDLLRRTIPARSSGAEPNERPHATGAIVRPGSA